MCGRCTTGLIGKGSTAATALCSAVRVNLLLDLVPVIGCPFLQFHVFSRCADLTSRLTVQHTNAVAGDVDILDVFRKPSDIPPHLDDILAKQPLPKVVWLQSGITHPEAEETLAKAGIKVVSNRCLKVDHQQAVMQSKM